MINERLVRWFTLAPYSDPIIRNRARSTYFIAVLLIIVVPIIYIPLVVGALSGPQVDSTALITLLISLILTYGATLLVVNLTRRGRQPIAGNILLVAYLVSVTFGLFNIHSPIGSGELLLLLSLWVGISLTALLTSERNLIYAAGLVTLGIVGFGLQTLPDEARRDPLGYLIPETLSLVSLMAATVIMHYLLARGQRDSAQRANLNAAKRLGLLEASNGVMQNVLSRLDTNQLLRETVRLVRATFNEVDRCQIWLVEADRRNVTLAAGGDEGAARQQLGVGSLSVIGRVTLSGERSLVRDVPEEQTYRRSALTPGIRSQLVLPLKVAEDVIGALDVQSHDVDAFGTDVSEVMQTLANQIAVAIDNARLFASSQQSLEENKRLYDQTRVSLREIERLNQQLTGQAWSEFLKGGALQPAYTLDLASGEVDNSAEWTSTLEEASRSRLAAVQPSANGKTVSLPVAVRGQVIGAMEFELDSDQDVSPEQMLVIQQVVERMGLAVDNVRLFEEAQRIAQREAMVNAISARLQSTTNVDTIVAAATQSLAETLNSPRVAIRLGALPASPAVNNRNERS